jgi:uncharacterized protein YbaP (TraB family)
MNMLKKVALTVLLSASISVQAASVWKVTDGENSVYFGGTIHILKAENLPLPTEYDRAYAASDKLVFETDIDGIKTVDFQQKMLSKLTLTDGTTLQSHLNDETYTALKTHLDSRGLQIVEFHRFKPSMLALMISMMEFRANGYSS